MARPLLRKGWCLFAREQIHGVPLKEGVPDFAIMSERVIRPVESKALHQVGDFARHARDEPRIGILKMRGDSFECGGCCAVHFHKSNLALVTGDQQVKGGAPPPFINFVLGFPMCRSPPFVGGIENHQMTILRLPRLSCHYGRP